MRLLGSWYGLRNVELRGPGFVTALIRTLLANMEREFSVNLQRVLDRKEVLQALTKSYRLLVG